MKIVPSKETLSVGDRSGPEPTRTLADFVAGTHGDAVPDAVSTCIETCLPDFAGNASFAAAFAESSPSFKAGARALDPEGHGSDIELVASPIVVTADSEISPLGCRMTVDDMADRTLEVPLSLDEPSTPLGHPRIKAKFLSLAASVYGDARADAIADRLLAAATEASMTTLIRSMRRT